MIAAVSIGKGPIFAWGYIRGNEGGLIVNKESVEWPNKWNVTVYEDMIMATSFWPTKSGGNTVRFELGLDGIARLFLEKAGNRELISEDRVFKKQKTLEGILYLVFNRNGFRTAFFHSAEYIEWKKNNDIIKTVRKNPSEYQVRDKRPSFGSQVIRVGRFEAYVSGKLKVITDGHIVFVDLEQESKTIRYVSAEDAKWLLLEKVKGARIERILVAEEPNYELDLPAKHYAIGC